MTLFIEHLEDKPGVLFVDNHLDKHSQRQGDSTRDSGPRGFI